MDNIDKNILEWEDKFNKYLDFESRINNNLNAINSQMFTLSNDVQTNIDSINEILLNLNNSIGQLKTENGKTIQKLRGVKEKYNAANEMISNYKNMYEYNYDVMKGNSYMKPIYNGIFWNVMKKHNKVELSPSFFCKDDKPSAVAALLSKISVIDFKLLFIINKLDF